MYTELLRVAADERKPVRFSLLRAPMDRWTEWHAYPTGDGVSAFVSDITQKKRLEDQLRQSANSRAWACWPEAWPTTSIILLVGIMGNASLAEEMLEDSHPVLSR